MGRSTQRERSYRDQRPEYINYTQSFAVSNRFGWFFTTVPPAGRQKALYSLSRTNTQHANRTIRVTVYQGLVTGDITPRRGDSIREARWVTYQGCQSLNLSNVTKQIVEDLRGRGYL